MRQMLPKDPTCPLQPARSLKERRSSVPVQGQHCQEELSTRKRALCWANTSLRDWHPRSGNKGGMRVPGCSNTLVSTATKHVAGCALDLQEPTKPSMIPAASGSHTSPNMPPSPNPLWNTQGAHDSSPLLPCSPGQEHTENALLHRSPCHRPQATCCPHALTQRPACLGRVKAATLPPLPLQLVGPALPRAKPCSQLVKLPGARNSQLNEQLKKGRQPILDRGIQSQALSRAPGPREGGEQHPSALAPKSLKSKLEEARDNRAKPSRGTFH